MHKKIKTKKSMLRQTLKLTNFTIIFIIKSMNNN